MGMRLIDADALMDSLDSLCDTVCQYSKAQRNVMCGACPLGGAFDVVEDAPTVDAVERKRGRWIDETFKPNAPVFHPYKCDQCGEHNDVPSDYCPNCGAEMRKGEEEEK